MSRGESAKISKQAEANSAQNQGNAQTALGGVNKGLDEFRGRLDQYYANDPYKTGGEFQTDQNNIIAGAANTGAEATKDALQRSSVQSGENTAGYAPAIVSAEQNATLRTGEQEAEADARRLASETAYQTGGLDQSKFPAQLESGIYGSSLGGANASLNTAQQASASSPGFWDFFLQQAQQGAKTGVEAASA